MKIADKIIGNILGKPRVRGGRKDYDGDGVPNKKDCQPRNTMRQDDYGECSNCGHKFKSGELSFQYPFGKVLCKDCRNKEMGL